MDFLTALRISGAGLGVERTRVNLATSNLANAETTRTAEGGPYKRLDPVIQAVAFPTELGAAQGSGGPPMKAEISAIVADQTPGKKVYSPGHPGLFASPTTPVNVLPRVFNTYFGMAVPEQPDTTFAWRDSRLDTVAVDPANPGLAR